MIHRRTLLMAFFAQGKKRHRDYGILGGALPVGPLNAITDVAGVKVGQTTLIEGRNIRTGVTVILPHGSNLFREKVRAAIFVGNGFGKLMGSTQVNELGEIESPIALTATLNVARVADAMLDYLLDLPGNEKVRSMNVVVGETNDGMLNDIRARRVGKAEVLAAGTGTVCFGTSSRDGLLAFWCRPIMMARCASLACHGRTAKLGRQQAMAA